MTKKLYRNIDTKLVAGVLSGLADYFNQDVVLWRVVAVVALIITGLMPGVLIYLVAWVLIPARRAPDESVRDAEYTVSE